MKETNNRGLLLKPNSIKFKLYAYPDAIFSGTFGHENTTGPACVNIFTGFVIDFADCPILSLSKIQTEIFLLTIESENIALDHCCGDLFPIIDITVSLDKSIVLPIIETMTKVSINEYNAGNFVWDKKLPP